MFPLKFCFFSTDIQHFCSVCETQVADGGSLVCTHHFCTDCFSRFISGSLCELDRNLRCCICGTVSSLIEETHNDKILLKFGRDEEPRIINPVALTVNQDNHFVIPDAGKKRILIFHRDGKPKNDFAYVHGTTPSGGATVTNRGFILIPFSGNKAQYGLSFYTCEGSYLTSTYISTEATIGGVAVNSKDHIYVTDPKNGTIYIIKEGRQKISGTVAIPRMLEDKCSPQPFAAVFDHEDNIIFTDVANHCVKVLDFENKFLFRFGSYGERPDQFNNPTGITVDDHNRIIVADRDNHRVSLFDEEGKFVEYIVRYEKGNNVFLKPIDVAVNSQRAIAVLLNGTRHLEAGEIRIYSLPDNA